ncbi:MAG: organic solvent tolerance protein OstA, partial [Odoribacter sp.]|nr:organic solvent tolerance protein OstA [Odoribacter sp.]
MAQRKTTIQIIHSDIGVPEGEKFKLIGNVELQHEDIVVFCDSLYQYQDSNYVEAFGHVHVIQGDSVHLWGDFMTYNGDSLLAKVRYNVIMDDGKVILNTDSLDYDVQSKIGHYFEGGTLRDSINRLESEIGYYYTEIDEMIFIDSVKVYTPEYTMYSDTLLYQTETKIITIVGPITIYGDDRTLYSEDGWYNSITSHAELYKNNKLTYGEYVGIADTMVIDSITSTAIMRKNIHLVDTVNNIIVEGHYGEVLKDNDYAFVTERAMAILVGERDSLYIHGDTISALKDSLENSIVRAFYHTRFYNVDLQGLCDSMTYVTSDSTVYLSGEPVVWADENQMTAEDIDMLMSENTVKEFHLNNRAMIINQLDSVLFNQIKGRNMVGHVRNGDLYLVDVNGNGETLYYPEDKDGIIGMHKGEG